MAHIQNLLVEDNKDDIVLAIEVLKEDEVNNKISIACDCEQVMEFINKEAPQCQSEPIGLILMNINWLHIYGKKMLIYNKPDQQYEAFQREMLTTSIYEKVIHEFYTNYAHCFIPNRFIWISFLKWFKKLKISGTRWYICPIIFNHA